MQQHLRCLIAVGLLAPALFSCSPGGGAGMPGEARALVVEVVEQGMRADNERLFALTLESPIVSSLLYDDDVIRFVSNPDSAPWYATSTTTVGQEYLRMIASGEIFEVRNLGFSNGECWDEEQVRACAADARIEVATMAEAERFFELGQPPAFESRVVVKRDPRVGDWRVEGARELAVAAQRHVGAFLAAAMNQRANAFTSDIERDRNAAVYAAYDTIYERLSSEFRRNDDGTVDVVQARLQFAPNIVQANSFGALFDACEGLTAAGRSDWRLPTRTEFLSVAAQDGQVWRVRDTPDRRIWRERFSPGNSFVLNAMMLVGRWNDFPYQEMSRHSGMIVAVVYSEQSQAAGGGLRSSMTYSSAGYYNASNVRTPGSTMSALCVRST